MCQVEKVEAMEEARVAAAAAAQQGKKVIHYTGVVEFVLIVWEFAAFLGEERHTQM